MAASVMVVDDDDGFRSLANRILADGGFRPDSEARSVSDALQQVTHRIPDVALVDIDLPDGNGLELSKQLAAPPWSVRVVLVSVDSDATTQKEATDAGAVGFLPKSDLSCASLRALLGDG
jgi:DNA-binding NarL/FixJ family response regulator